MEIKKIKQLENYSIEDIVELKSKLTSQFNETINHLDNELCSRKEYQISFFRFLKGLNNEEYPFLYSLFNNISFIDKVKGNVSTYRTDIPYFGLKIILNNQTYTIMYQQDSDYMTTLNDYCVGTDPVINRSSTNIIEVKYGNVDDIYSTKNLIEIEEYCLKNKELFGDNYVMYILTMLFCASQF